MATYRKPLKDINGDFIIPAMTGDQTGWVQTGDIADGAVTSGKIDFTLEAGTITIPEGSSVNSINSSYCYCRKFGNIVDIEFRGQLKDAWTAGTSKYDQLLIPVGFRPNSEITFTGYTGRIALFGWIHPTGAVELRLGDNLSTNQNFGAHTTFIIS